MTPSLVTPVRSNIEVWKRLQAGGYFEKHPLYGGPVARGGEEATEALGWLQQDDIRRLVVIGCGYGRETRLLAGLATETYGIDVSADILAQASRFLAEHGVQNFTYLAADNWEASVLDNSIDAFFSLNVMQHLTRDLVAGYFAAMQRKLRPGGAAVIQFLESWDLSDADAPVDGTAEPQVDWTAWQIIELARSVGLAVEIRTRQVKAHALWHWAVLRKIPA